MVIYWSYGHLSGWAVSCTPSLTASLNVVTALWQGSDGATKTHSFCTTTDIYISKCRKGAKCIMKDPTHLANGLFVPLPSGRRLQSIQSRSSRLKGSFFPTVVRLLNSATALSALTQGKN